MKLTELQRYKIERAYTNMCDVLREIKQRPLKGEAKNEMKTLEESAQCLEVFKLTIK